MPDRHQKAELFRKWAPYTIAIIALGLLVALWYVNITDDQKYEMVNASHKQLTTVKMPLLTEGVKIDLPQIESQSTKFNPDSPEPVVIRVDADGKLYIDMDESTPEQIEVYAKTRSTADFLVHADKTAGYDDVIKTMMLLKDAGVETVNLVTEPISN